jgi:L-ascorbate metabolism protein UlaG (beta-lactamase superfamily)
MRLFAFSLLLLAVAGVTAQPREEKKANQISLTWHGQSFFVLTTGNGTKIAFDPHAMPEYGRQSVSAELVLISHLHNDHSQPEILETKDPKILFGLTTKDKRPNWNAIDEKYKQTRIRTVGVYHDNEEGLRRGKNAIFIVETDGLKIAHLGDLGHLLSDRQIKEVGPVDILMIPVGGIYTINGEKAKEVVAQLKPRLYVVPMHYGTKVVDSLQPVDEFIDGVKDVKKLEDTNTLTIPADLKLEKPVTVLLSWK